MPHPRISISLAAVALVALAPLAHGATLYVANNGVDPPGCVPSFCIVGRPCRCGTKASPCRSITCGIMSAAAGDTIIVGPGVYGDLNRNGILGDSPGEETPSPGCGCMLSVNKGVTLLSSDGAAATIIDASTVDVNTNVLIIAGPPAATFGKPGKGFWVTSPLMDTGSGIVIDASNITVSGNQVDAGPVHPFGSSAGGIVAVDAPESILIQANQISEWGIGIDVLGGTGKMLLKNQVSRNATGIKVGGPTTTIRGNVLINNGAGIESNADMTTIVANAVYGNDIEGILVTASSQVEKNNLYSNGRITLPPNCGLKNRAVVGLLAENNYWGAATGPGPDPADDVCNDMGGTTTTAPFATKPFTVKAPIKP